MKWVFIIFLLFIAHTGFTQIKIDIDSSALIANQTIIFYKKDKAEINCYNKLIANTIYKKWGQLITKTRRHKHRRIKHWIFQVNRGDLIYILNGGKLAL